MLEVRSLFWQRDRPLLEVEASTSLAVYFRYAAGTGEYNGSVVEGLRERIRLRKNDVNRIP